MRLLLDTNIFLEILLDRANAPDCRRLFAAEAGHALRVTDFTLHSLDVFLLKGGRAPVFTSLLDDTVLSGAVAVSSLSAE